MAPWTSAQCIYEFLNSADTDPLLRAIIFFPTDGTQTIPPAANDALWDLNDGGHWKTDHNFAIYAVPSSTGRLVMNALADYSGNLTSVPHGHELSSQYHPSDYVRQIAQIPTNGGSQLPSLWVFLLIVLGLMVLAICGSSVGVHWHQKRMRNQLRDRVIRGEVDLEALGIRRLTVPQEVLDRMPVYIYHANTASSQDEEGPKPDGDIPGPTVADGTSAFSQPTCAICLDDFIDKETTVRELPCKHIYHPECIDNFLRDNSSLCPLCKKTVLPRGYCPAVITNAMVRRERWVRRVRQRAAARGLSDDQMRQEEERVRMEERTRGGFLTSLAALVMGGHTTRQRPATAADLEMQQANASPATSRSVDCPDNEIRDAIVVPAPTAHSRSGASSNDPSTETPSVPNPSDRPAAGTSSRREWARQRALALLGREHRPEASTVADDNDAHGRTRWRKALGRVWPTLG
ncbi:putative RING finger membrane protein [Diplodia seriata]|uniref:Putative RING finger membrane protein n=1 Tax=Diplodia seriata TaxID=420778 RepID=A0A1S8B558_9PEZI|nr:putative RING finger membrane protein [Diplodia seriata]